MKSYLVFGSATCLLAAWVILDITQAVVARWNPSWIPRAGMTIIFLLFMGAAIMFAIAALLVRVGEITRRRDQSPRG